MSKSLKFRTCVISGGQFCKWVIPNKISVIVEEEGKGAEEWRIGLNFKKLSTPINSTILVR